MKRVRFCVALVAIALLAAMRPADAFPKREPKCVLGNVCSGRPSPCLRVPVATGTLSVCGPGAGPASAGGWIGLLLDGLTAGDPTAGAEEDVGASLTVDLRRVSDAGSFGTSRVAALLTGSELDSYVVLIAGAWSRARRS
jgi:hypothetical protein